MAKNPRAIQFWEVPSGSGKIYKYNPLWSRMFSDKQSARREAKGTNKKVIQGMKGRVKGWFVLKRVK